MACPRLFARTLCPSIRTITIRHQIPAALCRPITRAYTIGAPPGPRPQSEPKPYDYARILQIATSKTSNSPLLVDVREPSEFAAGAIPGAINLPLASAPDALSLPADEFEDRFGFEKPDRSREVVFYCKAGVRSAAAARLALQEGFENVGEYRGSWMDWVKNREDGGKK
jgi:rhodanese-related sulfurtransferase